MQPCAGGAESLEWSCILAGQINGTTGYERGSSSGPWLRALNAALSVQQRPAGFGLQSLAKLYRCDDRRSCHPRGE
ncbi:hypothetical protein PE067_02645 [Paracoccus sp. DMF-8]|nr:FAD-dependent oxidoreductase [Paracoccus sp. DMF-8]MDF3605155.1 hypothetical protein [Paracoccus sp. DMF-8]